MAKQSASVLLVLGISVFFGPLWAQSSSNVVQVTRQGTLINWTPNVSFGVSALVLQVAGPPTLVEEDRLQYREQFSGQMASFDTAGRDPGLYRWSVDLVPSGVIPLDQQAAIRELPVAEQEAFLQGLRDQGILPAADQVMSQSGVFTIAALADGGLIIPEDNGSTVDNDLCPGTPAGEPENDDGCSISQLCPCAGQIDGAPWSGPAQYRGCVADAAEEFVVEGVLTQAQADDVVAQANASECGDYCPGTAAGEIEDPQGCSVQDLCPCDGIDGMPWKNHGEYTSCTSHTANDFRDLGYITQRERSRIVSEAARSSCGK